MNAAILLFCLFPSAIIATTPASLAANDLVLDVDGQFILRGEAYFLLPVQQGRGGGLQLAETGNETCPLTVVQSPYPSFPGLPITMGLPQSYYTSTIPANTPVRIAFRGVCAPTAVWQAVTESSPAGRSVKLGGDVDSYPFNVQTHGKKGYKLVYWPNAYAEYEDLGITTDDYGNQRLVVGEGETFVFKFKKAKSGRYISSN